LLATDNKIPKYVWEMTPEELKKHLRPIADKVLQETWDKNCFITYWDEKVCPSLDILVHEYKDRKELARIDDEGNVTFIKRLT